MNYALLADEKLLLLLMESDEKAFREIYLRYWQPLYITALKKVKAKEVAEELVQNLFIDLWDKRTIASVQFLPRYLNRAIKYQVINYIKSVIVRKKYRQMMSGLNHYSDSMPENPLLVHELSAAIDKAIARLPEKTQMVFRLSRYDNRTVREISQALNLSEKAVEYHITQSIKSLRLHLKDFLFLLLILLK